MFYVAKDKENLDAINLIKEVLLGHESLRAEKEKELNALQLHGDSPSSLELALLEEEIESLNAQIAAILYTYDYVRLMLKVANKIQ